MPKIYKLADGSHINVEDADVKFFTSSEMGKNAKEINFPTEGKQKGATTKSAVAAPNVNRKPADKKNTVSNSVNSSLASQKNKTLSPEEKVASDIAAYTARRKAKGLNTIYSPEQIKAKVKIEADSRKNKNTIAPITSAEEEAYNKYRQNRILTQEDVDQVTFNVNKEKQFKTKADKVRDESWTDIGASIENFFTGAEDEKYVPFEAERKQALAEAKIKNQKLTNEQLNTIAERKYKFNQYKAAANKKSEQYLKDIGGDEQDLLESRSKKSVAANKKRIATQSMLSKDLAGYDYEFKKIEKELKAYGNNPKFSTQDDVDLYNFKVKQLKDIQGFAKNTYEAYKGNLEDYDKSNDKLGSPEEEYDLAKRHYGFGWELTKVVPAIENFVEGAVGVVSMLNDAATYFPRKIANDLMGQETNFLTEGTKSILEFKREREKIQEGFYAKPREVENVETFMEKGWDLVATQFPNIILMALTGGGSRAVTLAGEEAVALAGKEAAVAGTEAVVAGAEVAELAAGQAVNLGGRAAATEIAEGIGAKLTNSAKWLDKLKATRVGNTVVKAATLEGTASKTIAASAAGSKYLDLADTNEKGITNYSPIQMVASSLLYGYAEGAGENVTTDIFKGAIRPLKALGNDVSKQAFIDSLKKETIASWFGKRGMDMLNENISEQVTNIAQNSIDKFMLGKDVGILDNTGTVFKDTTLLTGLMLGAPQIGGLAIKPFIQPTTQQKMRDNSSEIARLMVNMNEPNISPATLKAYQSKAEALTNENAAIVQKTIDRIGGMPDDTYKNMLSLDQQQRDLQVEAGKIMKSNESEQSKAQSISILSDQYKAKADQLNDLQANIELMDGISSAYEPKVRKDIYNLLIKAKDINTSMKSLNELQQTEAKQELKVIQDQLVSYSNSRVVSEAENKKNTSLLNKNLATASKLAEKIRGGKEFNNAVGEGQAIVVANTTAEAQAIYSQFLNNTGKEDSKFDSFGVKLPNGQILIDKQYALAAREFNVGGHEVLHVILKSQFDDLDIKEATELKDKFISVLSDNEKIELFERLKAYTSDYLDANPDEYLTQFFEIVAEGKLTWTEKLADTFYKIGKLILPFLKQSGFQNLEFKDGKDVYDFIKSYNKDLRRGNLNERGIALGKKGIETESEKESFSKDGLKDMASKIDRHVVGTGAKTNQEFRESPKTAGWFFEIEDNRQFESYLKSMITADKNLGGLDSDIKEDVLRQLKETIQDRVLKNFTPVLDGKERSLFSYIYGKGDSNGTGGIAYKSLLDIKKKYATSTDNVSMDYSDGTTADFADESITTEELTDLALSGELEAQSSKLRKEIKANGEIGINQALIDQLKSEVITSLESLGIEPTDKDYRKKLIDLYRAKLKAPIAKLIGGGDAYGKFLKDNKETLIDNLPVSYFVQIERLKPAEERIFSSPVKRLTTQAEIDKYTNLGLAYTESDASGPWLYKKLMPSDEAIAEFYGTNPGSKLGSTKGTRKDELARIIGVTLASDMTPTVLREKEQAGDISTADKNKIAERLQRDPDLKFSKAANIATAIFLLAEKPNYSRQNVLYRAFLNTLTPKEKAIVVNEFKFKRKPALEKIFSDIWESDKGVKYEKDVYVKLRSLANSKTGVLQFKDNNGKIVDTGYKLVDLTPDRFNRWKDDLVLKSTEDGKSDVVNELKSKESDPMGSTSNPDFIKPGVVSFKKDFNDYGIDGKKTMDEVVDKVLANTNRTAFINLLLSKLNDGSGDVIIKPGTNTISISTDFYKNEEFKRLKKLATTEVKKLNISAITKLNDKKHVLSIRGKAPIAFRKGDPSTGSPTFTGLDVLKGDSKVSVEFRTNADPSDKTNRRVLLERAYFYLGDNVNIKPGKDISEDPIAFFNSIKQSRARNDINTIAAIENSLDPNRKTKGISVLDFDDTLARTKSNVLYTMPQGWSGKLNAEEFAASGEELLEAGAVFDFSEFSKVNEGSKGPMFGKAMKLASKFGNKDVYVLTARPANSKFAIHQFLKEQGLNLRLDNIVGLGNSSAQAKADWITAKAAEGYNDFYFSDDAIQNVEAVQKALDIPGVDSKVRQAIMKFSLSTKVNLDWETNFGVTSADFKVGQYTYNVNMSSVKGYGIPGEANMDEAFEKIANNLKLPVTYLTENDNIQWVGFTEKKLGFKILNTGNAFEVLGIVTNALADYVQKNKVEGIAFGADNNEPSRIRLYKTLASTLGGRLGWEYTSVNSFNEDNGVVFVLTPSKNNSFKNQPKEVQDVLNVVDVKSPMQQSKTKFSKGASERFNKIIEANKGVEDFKVFSDITARRRGAKKNLFDIYVPPSAADFELLLYKFLGKGAEGEEQKRFFDDMLLKPYAHGNDLMDAARQSIKNDFKELLNTFPGIKKKLESLIPDGDYTYDQAIRVAMWADEQVEIPGIAQRDIDRLVKLVNEDAQLKEFKDRLILTGRQGKGWIAPEKFWDANTIISDLHNLTEGIGRKKFLKEFIENVEQIFGTWEEGRLVGPNMNKIEAVYGTNVREALEDVIYRMTAGKNRGYGSDKDTTAWNNWVNGSTGTIMFLNTRSAVLQLIGAFNFLNFRDNNPYAAAKAFANQKQYWEDFATIWNSDKMKERRGGLKEDVAAAEIANAAAGSKNKVNAVVSYLLKIGYTPTQLADSFAIASGGSPFYRNRVKTYVKEGLSIQEAEAKAWDDFTKVSDETQQSGDPRDISKQQASAAGRLLLTFQNTAMQQSRIVKKSFLDLKNGRGDAKTHVAKIAYYLAVQNIMFSVLQQGLFAVMFDDDDDGKDAKAKKEENKALGLADDVLDTILRGTGFTGGIVATLKNMALKYLDEKDKNFKADYAKVVLEGANISPPIGSKLRKLYSGFQQTKFDKDLIAKRGWGIMQDGRVHLGPNYSITGKLVESTTNLPMDRFVNKVENVSQALNSQNEAWQRVMVGLGWNPYSLGIEGSATDKVIREEAKAERKEAGLEKAKATREATKRAEEEAFEKLPQAEKDKIALQKFNEKMKKFEEKVKKDALEEANMTPDEIALKKFQKKMERKAKTAQYKERKLRAQKIRDSINFDAYMKKKKQN